MEEHNGRREAVFWSVDTGDGPDGRNRTDSAGSVASMIERLDSLGLRLGGELARLRETVEIQNLNLFGRAIEALSSLEADWVRAHSEADSLREKLREATLEIGELQQQFDRIADLRRKAEAEAAELRDELQRELEQARQDLAQARDAHREAQRIANEQRDAAQRECIELQQRISWRITAPLRSVRSLFPKNHG